MSAEGENPIVAPPRSGRLWREARGLLEPLRLLWWLPRLVRLPRGRGKPVLVVPGFLFGDGSTLLLRGYLYLLGYRVRGWGLGRNLGKVEERLPELVERVTAWAAESGRPVSLVGWSLGGFLAREVARDAPAAVARVITLGTPVVGGPKYTVVAEHFARQGHDLDALEAAVEEREKVPLRVPVTAVYTRKDNVVAWRASIDHRNPGVEHVEVGTTHVGLGLSPEVYYIIARSLAA